MECPFVIPNFLANRLAEASALIIRAEKKDYQLSELDQIESSRYGIYLTTAIMPINSIPLISPGNGRVIDSKYSRYAGLQEPINTHKTNRLTILDESGIEMTIEHLRPIHLNARVEPGSFLGVPKGWHFLSKPHIHVEFKKEGRAFPMTFKMKYF